MPLHTMPYQFFGGKLKNNHFIFESIGTLATGYHLQSNISNKIHPLTRVQTDGTLYSKNKTGAVAALLYYQSRSAQGFTHPLEHLDDSTEAQWASVYFGLEMAKRSNQSLIGIENDSLSVIRHIMCNDTGGTDYARYYNHKIKEVAEELQWCGVRWIPRELNRANTLLR